MSDPSSSELDASCDICGSLRREPPSHNFIIAKAFFVAFANSAMRGCIFCTLICNTVTSRLNSWGSVARDKLLIVVRISYTRNDGSNGLAVRVYEVLRPCRLEQAERMDNSRFLFCAIWYSPLGKTMRCYHN